MKYNVHYGKAPFPVIGSIIMPNDDPKAALSRAITEFVNIFPEGVRPENKLFYHHHPVVSENFNLD